MKPERVSTEKDEAELTRREALVMLGAGGVVALTGCGAGIGGAGQTTSGDDSGIDGGDSGSDDGDGVPSCVVTPEQTEGPYFVDELLNRSDIRTDPTDDSVQEGVPLRLRITVSQVSGGSCSPLAGAQVDVWHCNADGVYSDVAANGTVGQKFLRGFQVTDDDGVAEFTTIYPGWYSGRTVHIHFKIRFESLEFTSQLYFDEDVTAEVFEESPYSERGSPDTTNARDNIFSEETLLTMTPEGDGFLGSFDVGLRI